MIFRRDRSHITCKVMYSMLDFVSVSGIPSPLTVSQRQQHIRYVPFAITLLGFDFASAAERMKINFTIKYANTIRFQLIGRRHIYDIHAHMAIVT